MPHYPVWKSKRAFNKQVQHFVQMKYFDQACAYSKVYIEELIKE